MLPAVHTVINLSLAFDAVQSSQHASPDNVCLAQHLSPKLGGILGCSASLPGCNLLSCQHLS